MAMEVQISCITKKGSAVARYCGECLHQIISEMASFKSGDYQASLREGFIRADEILRQKPEFTNQNVGSTSVVSIITSDNKLFVANAGDSRAILCRKGEAIPLTFDHKPDHIRTF
jgi:protein phosphatase 2C family protein 2/3